MSPPGDAAALLDCYRGQLPPPATPPGARGRRRGPRAIAPLLPPPELRAAGSAGRGSQTASHVKGPARAHETETQHNRIPGASQQAGAHDYDSARRFLAQAEKVGQVKTDALLLAESSVEEAER